MFNPTLRSDPPLAKVFMIFIFSQPPPFKCFSI